MIRDGRLSGLHSEGFSTSFEAGRDYPFAERSEEEIPKHLAKQLGTSGVLRDNDGIPIYDPNPGMSPLIARGLGVDCGELHRVFFYDPVVSGVFTLMLVEVLRAFWGITDHRKPTELEKEKKKVFEFLFGLAGKPGIMGGGIRRLIFHLFWANLYGFSLNELVWDYVKIDGKKYILPVDSRWRAPWSVYRWLYSGEDLVGFTQLQQVPSGVSVNNVRRGYIFGATPGGFVEKVIPIDKCLLRSNRGVDGNPEGISDFRTAYIYVKAKLEQVQRDQIADDRLANGIVMVKELGDDRGPYRQIGARDRAAVKTCLDFLAKGQTNRIIVPYGLDIELQWPTYDRPDRTDRLKWLDHQIMLGSTSSVLGLDATRAASRGLSDGLAMLAFHAIEAAADDIADVINGVPGRPWTGIVNKVEMLNWPGDTKSRPTRLEHFGISYQDAEKMVNTFSKASQMLLMTPDEYDENKFRATSRIGTSDVESIRDARAKVQQQSGQLSSQGEQARIAQPNQPRSKPTDGNGDSIKDKEEKPK